MTTITFIYVNYRGEVRSRTAQPLGTRFGTSKWHPDPQWLMRAIDMETGAEREFAEKDMTGVVVTKNGGEAKSPLYF